MGCLFGFDFPSAPSFLLSNHFRTHIIYIPTPMRKNYRTLLYTRPFFFFFGSVLGSFNAHLSLGGFFGGFGMYIGSEGGKGVVGKEPV